MESMSVPGSIGKIASHCVEKRHGRRRRPTTLPRAGVANPGEQSRNLLRSAIPTMIGRVTIKPQGAVSLSLC